MFTAPVFVIAKKLETTETFFKGWMDKQTVVHPYHGILHSSEKEFTFVNLDDSQRHYDEREKSALKCYILHDSIYTKPSKEIKLPW